LRAPHIEVATEGKAPQVINIMDALKKSMESRGRAKVRDAVRKRMGKPPKRKRQGRELQDHDQAHAGRRIELIGKLDAASLWESVRLQSSEPQLQTAGSGRKEWLSL